MTEVAFAKSFLSSLDTKSAKISADHVEDPRSYPARSAYILPKSSHPLPKRQKLAPGAEPSYTVTLRSLRNPPLDITLHSLPGLTSILDLKTSINMQTTIPITALRILHNKKPIPDSKVLKDVVKEGEEKVEFGVMVIGGAGVLRKRKSEEEILPVDLEGTGKRASGAEVLQGEEFWNDLKGFLTQRLRDEAEGEKAFSIFRKAWEGKR